MVTAPRAALWRPVQPPLRGLAVITMAALLATKSAHADEGSYFEFEPVDGAGAADQRTVADRALAVPLEKLTHEPRGPRVLNTDFNGHSCFALYNPQFVLGTFS